MFTFSEVARSLAAIPPAPLVRALAAAVGSYVVLGGNDLLALEYVGHRLPARRALFASFIAYAVGQSIGFGAFASAPIRYRFWSRWGLTGREIAGGIAFTSITFWLGIACLGGGVLIARPDAVAGALHGSPGGIRLTGALLVTAVGAYLAAAVAGRPIRIRKWSFMLPGPRLAAAQLAIAALDWTLAGLVLVALLPGDAHLGVAQVLGVFLVAQVAGLVSHVPGGLGVFETVVMMLLGGLVPVPQLLAALVAYRVIYYLLPLAIAVLLVAGFELARYDRIAERTRTVFRFASMAAPYVLSAAVFGAGVLLLLSGATPALHHRLWSLHRTFPLAVLEVSHFAASIAGMALILVARGLRQRLDAAYHLAIIALVVGIVGSLLKGLDYEEAVTLAAILAITLPARGHFYRRAALTSEPLTRGWIVAVLLAVGGTVCLGLFSYKHVAFSSDLWWHFALRGDAPRFLRAMVGVAGVVLAFAIARLLRPGRVATRVPSDDELARISDIVRQSSRSGANLALLGDKALMFGEYGTGFLMYAIEGRSWIALGDPTGTPAEQAELVWRFREAAHRHGGIPVFYEVSRDHLPLYIDLGLTLLKLGEEARVPLGDFTLEGPERRALRRAVRDAERHGCTFEIVPAAETAALLPELRRVSDAWLELKRTREKGFSLGYFDERYLAHFPTAVVRRAGAIVAFANVWTTGTKQELSVDLMRFTPEAPNGVIDYLLAEVLSWGAARGYEWFNLGMAPLSGLERRALAPVWNRLGALVFGMSEHFYNFRGLRQYKEKFRPVWEPRYLAAPGGLALPRVLTSVTTLVAGGVMGVVSK